MPKSTQDPIDPKGLFALFKGESGTGKSVAALSFPTPYVIDFDMKMPSISNKHFPRKDVYYDHPEDIFKASELISELSDNCPYETVILDTITSLTQCVMKSVADVKNEPTPELLGRMKAAKGKAIGKAIEMLGYDYYNGETRFVKWILDELKSLWAAPGNPKHVIVIAHVLAYKTEDIRTKLVTEHRSIVTAGKQIAAYIPAQFDDMYHFYRSRPEVGSDSQVNGVAVITESIGDDSAKSSYKLPGIMDVSGNKSFYDEFMEYM